MILHEISLSIGDILYDGFDTSLLFYAPLDCALDDLKLRYEIHDAAIVLVNDEAVSRTWYQLEPGDEIRILFVTAPSTTSCRTAESDSASLSKETRTNPDTTEKRPKRSEKPDDDEANLLIKRFLKDHPKATIRDVANEVGLSTGKVSGLEAWRNHMAIRRAAKPPAKIKERPLTKKMLERVGKDDDPVQQMIRNEAIWDYLLKNVDRTMREELLKVSEEKRKELIQLTWDQWKEELPPDLWHLE